MEEWKEECQCGMHEPGVASARHRRTRFIRKLNAIVHKERHDRRQTATLCRRLLQWLAPLRSRFGCNVPFTLFVGVEVHWLRRRPTKSSVHVICVLMPPFHHLRRIGEVLYIPWVSAAVATSFRDGVRRAALCKVPRAVQRRALRSTACAPPALLAISSSVGFTRDDDARARGSGGRAPPASSALLRDEPVRRPQRPLSRRANCVGAGRLRASACHLLSPGAIAACRDVSRESHRPCRVATVRSVRERFRFESCGNFAAAFATVTIG